MMQKLPVKRKIIDSTPPPRGDDDDRIRWADLPKYVLLIIFRKLEDHNNNMIYRCGRVCVSWLSVVRASLPQYLLLSNVGKFKDRESVFQYMYHNRDDYSKNIKSCVLFDLFTKRIREISLPEELLKGRWFTGSSSGWLLTIGIESPHEMHLVNPFCPEQKIELPNATKLRFPSSHDVRTTTGIEIQIDKNCKKWRVVTSTNPLDPNCIFVVTDVGFPDLIPAFCRRGDKYWTTIENLRLCCCDVIFYKDCFYTIDTIGQFFSIHVKSLVPPVTYLGWSGWKSHIHCLSQLPHSGGNYLVEFDGDLLQVIRRTKKILQSMVTVDFEVYKWNPTKKKWSEMISIGNNVILLGKYSSISIPVSPPCSLRDHGVVVDCMWCSELKANCIYFIDDVYYYMSCSPQHEAGVYNMTNHRIDWFPESWPIWTSPLNWLRPML